MPVTTEDLGNHIDRMVTASHTLYHVSAVGTSWCNAASCTSKATIRIRHSVYDIDSPIVLLRNHNKHIVCNHLEVKTSTYLSSLAFVIQLSLCSPYSTEGLRLQGPRSPWLQI